MVTSRSAEYTVGPWRDAVKSLRDEARTSVGNHSELRAHAQTMKNAQRQAQECDEGSPLGRPEKV